MSPTQRLDTHNQEFISAEPIDGPNDPEALQGTELSAAASEARTKHDDPYLVCFDATYDTEKCATSTRYHFDSQSNVNSLRLAQKTGPPSKNGPSQMFSQQQDSIA